MTEPTAAAGRALLNRLGDLPKLMPYDDEAREFILAIEAEARQQDTSALRRALQDLVWAVEDYADNTSALGPRRSIVAARAALAALPPSAPPELDEQVLRIAYEAGRTAADFEETLARINATMTADTTEIAANLARLEQDHP